MDTAFALWALLAQAGTPPAASSAGNALAVWAIILLGIAIALFIVELFIPSGGVIGFLSAASLVGGIVLLFRIDTGLGMLSALVALLALPFAIAFAIRIWPDTWFANLLTLQTQQRAMTQVGEEGAEEAGPVAAAPGGVSVGQRGRAVTDLHPIGACLIEGRRTECMATGELIEAGREVEVVVIDGMQVRVRAV